MIKIEKIQLTGVEQELYNSIFPFYSQDDDVLEKLDHVHDLSVLLFTRNAIPEHRITYFKNPDYNLGKGKGSKFDNFNGNIRRPQFIKYLKYFIDGADLPKPVCQECEKIVTEHSFYPEDALPELKKYFLNSYGKNKPRQIPTDFDEHVFRLGLDLTLPLLQAQMLRNYVKRLRWFLIFSFFKLDFRTCSNKVKDSIL